MKYRVSIVLFLLLVSISIFFFEKDAKSEIFKIVMPDGVLHITDKPSRGVYPDGRTYKERREAGTEKFGKIIKEVAEKHGMDPRLIEAVIKQESGFNPGALSPKGAMGLMQLMPSTAERFGVKDPFDPRDNIRGGADYLYYLLKIFRGDLRLTLAAYNAGEKRVKKNGGIPPFKETKEFVLRVMRIYDGFGSVSLPGIYRLIRKDGTIFLTNRPENIQKGLY